MHWDRDLYGDTDAIQQRDSLVYETTPLGKLTVPWRACARYGTGYRPHQYTEPPAALPSPSLCPLHLA